MKIFKKIVLLFTLVVISGGVLYAAAPSFDRNFADYLVDDTPDRYGRVETVFNIGIDRNLSLMDNVKMIFYPSNSSFTIVDKDGNEIIVPAWGTLWSLIRSLWFIILFVFLVVAWINLIVKAKEPEETKKAFTSLIYILFGAFLLFWVTWILWTVLDVGNIQWSTAFVDSVQNKLFFQILSFFKVLAFFAAILMLVVAGFRMMAAMDKSEKVTIARKWAINVVVSLVMIKLIDYIFYIAQTPEFSTKLSDMIVNVAITLWWILGSVFVLAIFYAWYMLIVSWGKEESFKKAKSIIVNIFVISLVVFIFLLLVYQVFKEFA